MAQSAAFFFFFFVISIALLHLIFATASTGQTLPTQAIIAPISFDSSTSLYTFTTNDGRSFVIDLSGQILWQTCRRSHPTFPCNSSQCSSTLSHDHPSCHPPHFESCSTGGACTIPLKNFNDQKCTTADLTQTTLTLNSTNGRNPTNPVRMPHLTSACSPASFLATLPSHAQGVAPLGAGDLSLPHLFASAVPGLKKRFAICLDSGGGLLFLGDGPLVLVAGVPFEVEVISMLAYTQLVKRPSHPLEHFITLTAIAVDGEKLKPPIRGGVAALSTTVPYTSLSTPIYNALTATFNKKTSQFPRVEAVWPFQICLNASVLLGNRMGAAVPSIDLMVNGFKGHNWTIFGANSMVYMGQDAACLAFLDGGSKPKIADVVIGSYQMENSFVLFDLEKSKLGFLSGLTAFMTTCSNFNFTSSP